METGWEMDTETLQDDMQGKTTHHSRADGSVITTATRNRFDAAAHAVRPLLVTRLRRAGASPEDAEDVTQEALLRAWDRGIHFADDGDLLRWCTVVARRSHIDRLRRQSRLLDLGDPASEGACRELEAVELRHVLGTVSAAMASLTEQERASLQAQPSEPRRDRASQVRSAVARHRARCRLRLLVGPFGAALSFLVRALRRGAPPAAAAATAALAAAALSGSLGGLGDRSGQPPARHAIQLANPVTSTVVAPVGLHHRRGASSVSRSARLGAAGSRHGSGPVSAPTQIADVDGPAGSKVNITQQDVAGDPPFLCLDVFPLGKHECTPQSTTPHPPSGIATP
ncbi:MAG: Sigma-70 region 2 [Frankiaceae bacterium]|jgi:RNA polymerase sigma factor (sigma-70 family)|nr:Sigma-70 region 2 [Frankiaceae bacterium]